MEFPAQHTTSLTGWFKSSYSSSTGSCVEIRFDHGTVGVRDSKRLHLDAREQQLTLGTTEWATFLRALQA